MTYAAQPERGGDARVGESRSRERRPSTADPRNRDTCLIMNSDARRGLRFPTGLRSRKLHRATRDPLPSSLKAQPHTRGESPAEGQSPGLPTPNLPRQPPSPATAAGGTLPHLLTLRNNTLITIKISSRIFR